MWLLVLYVILLICGIVFLVFPKRDSKQSCSFCICGENFSENCCHMMPVACLEIMIKCTSHCPHCLERLPVPPSRNPVALLMAMLTRRYYEDDPSRSCFGLKKPFLLV